MNARIGRTTRCFTGIVLLLSISIPASAISIDIEINIAGLAIDLALGTEVDTTTIHIGDIHGHLVPRPDVRGDAPGTQHRGGLARMYTKINQIRTTNPNVISAQNIQLLRDANNDPLDATEVVVQYLQTLPNQTANPQLNRIQLLQPLLGQRFGFPETQPLRGAQP
jgi:hypothetical protein